MEKSKSSKFYRWVDLCKRIDAKGDYIRPFRDIVSHYSNPSRFYHTMDHVVHCLDEFKEARHLVEHPGEIEMALWLHDVIYDPVVPPKKFDLSKLPPDFLISDDSARRLSEGIDNDTFLEWINNLTYPKDNERRSAQLAYELTQKMELPDEFIQRTYDLIFATAHRDTPDDIDSKIIIDVDLSVLGQPIEIFDKYEENIRKEFIIVPTERYKKDRTFVLNRFLERESIYHTEFFIDKYELRARENLERSIAKLT
jgi:predicted metal-dependent HD superfamily phosphohydrolase